MRNKHYKKLAIGILAIYPIAANSASIDMPFLNDIWSTLTQNVLPIIMGIGLLGAFIADRQDSETGKRIMLTVAGLAVALKIVLAFIAWVRTNLAGL